jgi:hypothetical protein
LSTRISCAVIIVLHGRFERFRVELELGLASFRANFIRLIDARLHAESSRNMYSEHGLLALIRAVLGTCASR